MKNKIIISTEGYKITIDEDKSKSQEFWFEIIGFSIIMIAWLAIEISDKIKDIKEKKKLKEEEEKVNQARNSSEFKYIIQQLDNMANLIAKTHNLYIAHLKKNSIKVKNAYPEEFKLLGNLNYLKNWTINDVKQELKQDLESEIAKKKSLSDIKSIAATDYLIYLDDFEDDKYEDFRIELADLLDASLYDNEEFYKRFPTINDPKYRDFINYFGGHYNWATIGFDGSIDVAKVMKSFKSQS